MEPEEFIDNFITGSPKQRCLFHFTDSRNLPSIKKQGILCTRLLEDSGITPVHGGNDWSRDADKRFGMDRYVHLCFMKNHPMEFLARNEGRIKSPVYLEISPEVLKLPGGLITLGVANSSSVVRVSIADGLDKIDGEAIYRYTERTPEATERWKIARKCEILILDSVPPEYIGNL